MITLFFQQIAARKKKKAMNANWGRHTSVPEDIRLIIKDQEELETSYNSLYCISTMVFGISYNSSILPLKLRSSRFNEKYIKEAVNTIWQPQFMPEWKHANSPSTDLQSIGDILAISTLHFGDNVTKGNQESHKAIK